MPKSKFKMNTKKTLDLIKKQSAEHLRKEAFEIDCPECKEKFESAPGKTECPNCSYVFEFDLDITFK